VQQGNTSNVAQQGDASTIVNASSANVPDSGNSGTNTTQEHGVMDSNASFLSELGSRAPQFRQRTVNEFSPIHNQVASPTPSGAPSGINLSTPLRLDASGSNEVTVAGVDLLDAQGATTSSASVIGTHILAPSPR